MLSFQHVAPPFRLFCGPDCFGQLGRELERVGSRRAMILCGGSVARHEGLLDLLRGALAEGCAGVFSGVQAHSPVPSVEAAAEALRSAQADAVIAVGGGSASVTARAASILLAENGDARSLSTSRDASGKLNSPKLRAAKLPQFAVPTTPNTGLVKAGSAVFDPTTGHRLAMFDPKTRPQAIFLHPAMLASAPRSLVLSATLNAFVVTAEGLLSRAQDPFADASMMHALRLITTHLRDGEVSDDEAARADFAVAAVMIGQATDHTGFGVATVLAHATASRFHLENGLVKAAILPWSVRFNAAATQSGLDKLAACLGVQVTGGDEALDALIHRLAGISAAFGAPKRLRDIGVTRDAFPTIAEAALADWFLRSNPRRVESAAELVALLEQAW